MLFPILSLAASGCVTSQDGSAVPNASWYGAFARADDPKRPDAPATTQPPPAGAREDQASFLIGTGKFIGEQQPTTAQRPVAESEDGVTLNLVNVSIPQAAKSVLSDLLAVKYTVDPAIDGKVTIQTPRPVPKSEVVDLFQSALYSNGAAVINSGGSYKIVPADKAAVGASLMIGRPPDAGQGLGSRIQVVQLKYVAASEIRRVLEPISPRNAIVQTDNARNTITLSGNAQDIASMMDAISIFDIDVMKGMSFALVPVKTSQPQVIAEELRNVFSSDREGPMAGMVRFVPNSQLNAVLIISPQPEYLSRAETWVRRFDSRAEGSEKQFFTYLVQNRRAQELVDVVQNMLTNETRGARAATPRNVAPQYREAAVQSTNPVQAGLQSFGAQGMGSSSGAARSPNGPGNFGSPQGPTSQELPTGSASPAPVSGGEQGQEPRIKIGLDEGKNAILIQATPSDYRRVMRFIGSLDVMPKQVLIEATIAEVTLTDELKFGVRWYMQKKNATGTFSDDVAGALGSVFPGFSYAFAVKSLSETVNALNSITDVNVISAPSLTVMDNKTAMLQIGDEVPITTESAVSTLTAGAPVVNSISYKDTGIILSMTPRINASGRILLDLEQEVSTVAATTSSGIDSPTIHKRRIRTSVVVNNGEALALGGLIQDSKTVSRNQTPILGDIPIIGNIFRQKDNQIGKTELIIIIVPHLMRNASEARRVTDEYRRELAISSPARVRGGSTIEDAARRILE